jgi:hypothetical protein
VSRGGAYARADAGADWLRLDNAAKIYPAASTAESPAVFRLSATFERPVRIAALEQAFSALLDRCPYYQVYLRRGVFWYYLQKHERVAPIELLSVSPNLGMPIHQKNTPLLRLAARGSTMALDFSHILTDGLGGMGFLTSLAAEYLRRCGIEVEPWQGSLDPSDDPHPEEYEDAHRRHFESGRPKPLRLSGAYHLPRDARRDASLGFLTGRMPVDAVLDLARSLGVSLTEYLVALYIDSIARVRAEARKTDGGAERTVIRIQVPVNMRRHYASQTMRNFSLFVSPEIDLALGSYSFEEIARKTHLSMRMQLDRKELQRQISRNVAGELNGFVRGTPLFLKDLLLSVMHRRLGAAPYSGVLSNLGRIELPAPLHRHVKELGFYLAPDPAMRKNCSVLSYGDTLTVAFGSTITSRAFEKSFFTALVRRGVPVRIKEQ